MKIKKFELKKLNITALFDKIDQSSINSEVIRDLFELKPQERANTPFIDLPGTKVLIIPALKKEVVVEPNRLRVSDTEQVDPSSSKIVNDFKKVYEAFGKKSKLRAYGFNYDISIQLEGDISYGKLLSSSLKKLINSGKLLEAGAKVVYSKKGRKIDIQIVPSTKEKQLGILANVHYEVDAIDFKKLTEKLAADYKEIKQAVGKFVKG